LKSVKQKQEKHNKLSERQKYLKKAKYYTVFGENGKGMK
jgi:hypothetical protein